MNPVDGRGCKLPRAWLTLAAALLCALFLPGQARAQSQATASADSRTIVLEELSLTALQDMDFGRIAAPNAGTVVLTPNPTPICTVSAGLVRVGPCLAAVFGGAGSSGALLLVRLPPGREIVLTGPGADMTIDQMTVQGSPDLQSFLPFPFGPLNVYRIASPSGTFLFRVGGTLQVGANQAPGLYTGTFEMEVTYF